MRHTKHLWRALIILVAGAVVAVSGRHFLIPESFGQEGYYRYDSVGEYMADPVMHGNDESCAKCHRENYQDKKTGKHQVVRCENCHGTVTAHADENGKIADALVNDTYELCALCHLEQEARPKDFPQLDFRQHLLDQSMPIKDKIPAKACKLCHSAHRPDQD